MRPRKTSAQARAPKAAVDASVRTMFQATQGVAKSSCTAARFSMRAGSPACFRSSLSGMWIAKVTTAVTVYAQTRANGQPALGTYLFEPRSGAYLPVALDVLTLRGDLIADLTVFRTPAVFPRFELPSRLHGPAERTSDRRSSR
jgi:hypothetical protein